MRKKDTQGPVFIAFFFAKSHYNRKPYTKQYMSVLRMPICWFCIGFPIIMSILKTLWAIEGICRKNRENEKVKNLFVKMEIVFDLYFFPTSKLMYKD